MKNSVKKIVKTTAILLLALIFAGSPAISPITSKTTIEAEASAKSDKAVKQARKCYYTTQRNLKNINGFVVQAARITGTRNIWHYL